MRTKRRFGFWRVFWVVLALYLIFNIIGAVFIVMAPSNDKQIKPEELLTLKHLISQLALFVFILFYYYFTLNGYYRLIQQKKSAFHYLRFTVVVVLALVAFY